MEEEQHKCREREGSSKVMTSPSLKPPQPTLAKSRNAFLFLELGWCTWGSHDGTALGSLLAEGGGQELCLAGQVKEAFGEPAGGALLYGGLQFVEARKRR